MKLPPLSLAASLLVLVACNGRPDPAPGLTNQLRAPVVGRTGVADDGVKPAAKTGIPDDSIKPAAKTGIPDDGIKPRPVAPKPVTLPAPARLAMAR